MELKKVMNVEYYSATESETIVVRIPKDSNDPRSGVDSLVFGSCEEFSDWLRKL